MTRELTWTRPKEIAVSATVQLHLSPMLLVFFFCLNTTHQSIEYLGPTGPVHGARQKPWIRDSRDYQ